MWHTGIAKMRPAKTAPLAERSTRHKCDVPAAPAAGTRAPVEQQPVRGQWGETRCSSRHPDTAEANARLPAPQMTHHPQTLRRCGEQCEDQAKIVCGEWGIPTMKTERSGSPKCTLKERKKQKEKTAGHLVGLPNSPATPQQQR